MVIGAAAARAAAAAELPKFRYLSAWFCPFAHRATLALEHHRDRVDYEWVEALGWFQGDDSNNVTGTGREWYYHWKADELKRVNPSELVPTLVPIDPRTGEADESRAVWESLIAVDYVDAVSGATGRDRLNPQDDPYEAARCRLWAEKVNRECCSPYYGVLVRKDAKERREHFDQLLSGLKRFSDELKKTSGPLFLAENQLSNVDVALIPWAYRYYVFEHYRGPAFVIPETTELEPYHEWYDAVMALDSVQRTLPDKDRYLDHIQKYADGSARSKVANAVRRGVAAHEFDDEKDDYR
jgi:glutathione S-transferase